MSPNVGGTNQIGGCSKITFTFCIGHMIRPYCNKAEKHEKEVLWGIMSFGRSRSKWNNGFVSLPTGSGKSLCYSLLL